MTQIVNAIVWNDSNLFGFLILFRSFFRSSIKQVCLSLYLGPKVSQEARYALRSSGSFFMYPIHCLRVYEVNSKIDHLSLSLLGVTFAGLFDRTKAMSMCCASAYFMPSPSSPPLLCCLPHDICFYGDGLGSTPSLSYQWQPSLFRLPLISKLRYLTLILDRFASKLTKNTFTQTFYDLLDSVAVLKEVNRTVEFLYARNSFISSYLESCSFRSSNIVIALSILSPSRCSFQSEVDLYADQLLYSPSKKQGDLANSAIFIKFHYHHSQEFKDKFLSAVSDRLGCNVNCLELNIPVEALGCLLLKSFPTLRFTFYCYQESIRLIKLFVDHGSFSSGSLGVVFGFDDFLLARHLSQIEASKKIKYQNNVRSSLLVSKSHRSA